MEGQMLIWSSVLLALGALAFLDSQFNYGYIFRSVNSVLFMLVSLGLLVRTRILIKLGFQEHLISRNGRLEELVREQDDNEPQSDDSKTRQAVTL
jgi:hypothetical protein